MSMSLKEWNEGVDQWIAKQNKNIGRVYKHNIGMYPAKEDGLLMGEKGINNKLATRDLIRHYADAIGDTNPLWRSDDYARLTRYGSIIAPPRFLDCIAPPDGMAIGIPDFGGLPHMNPLNRGSNHMWFCIVRPGDEFATHDRILGVKEVSKKDRPMPRLFLMSAERKYINQRDEVVAIITGGAIVVGSGPELKGADPAFSGIKKHKYSDKELAEIDRAYDTEVRRGREVRYWEDVNEGEEMPSLMKGPLTYMDSVAFFNAIGYVSGFKVTHLLLKEYPGWGVRDPETNVIIPPSGIHISDTNAQAQGVPFAIGFSALLEGHVVHLITNWMGDDGFLKKLDCQSRRIYTHGDMLWLKGKVTKKYIENNEHLVELQLTATNQDGTLLMPANAVVRLISKADN